MKLTAAAAANAAAKLMQFEVDSCKHRTELGIISVSEV